MVIGVFSTRGDAEVCLGNLAEAGFAAKTVSVVADETAVARALARSGGPLHARPPAEAWTRLRALGLPEGAIDGCRGALDRGGVLLALSAPPDLDAVAAEMLRDHGATDVAVTVSNPSDTQPRPRSRSGQRG